MLQVYDDRLFLPQNWKLPSQFIKSVNKNSPHTEVDSFTENPSLPHIYSISQIKSEMSCYMRSIHILRENALDFYFLLLNFNKDDFDEVVCFWVSGDTSVKPVRLHYFNVIEGDIRFGL